jgi:hypothetical protein
MTVSIAREAFTAELAAEILPLAQKCWNESTEIKGETCAYYGEREFAIEPNTQAYLSLAEQGLLVSVAVRNDAQLVGYLLGFLYPSLHHKNILCGIGDSVYIEPGYRSYTGVVAEIFEKEMQRLGAQIIGWPTHIDGPVYQVLKARQYVSDDIVMEKRLR